MTDHELKFVDELIQERRRAELFYLTVACGLAFLALFCFFSLLPLTALDKGFPKLTGVVVSLTGAIPAHLCFAVREQSIYFRCLRASWEDARIANDMLAIEKLKVEFSDLRKTVLGKTWWSK